MRRNQRQDESEPTGRSSNQSFERTGLDGLDRFAG